MKKNFSVIVFSLYCMCTSGQSPLPPDKIYGQLFEDVQLAKVFPDGKTFVDCIPKRDPAAIVADFKKLKNNPAVRYSLQMFVEQNFIIPATPSEKQKAKDAEDLASHVKSLWKVLKRDADKSTKGSSLLPLPYSYIVPGGRFREIYYWDSYFTMLGLQESGEVGIIENMIKNFAFLINKYGHIPNGNRSYYLSRSQPPFFSHMVSLLAEVKGESVFKTYVTSLEKEYNYWMEGAVSLKPGEANKRVVKLPDGALLNRYWDESTSPRQESYAQDVETAGKSNRNTTEVYQHLRAGAASGWDFSSRWFSDSKNITTINTTNIIPVDLNSLLYSLERNLAKGKALNNEPAVSSKYREKALLRKNAVLKHCWNNTRNFFTDFNFKQNSLDTGITAAGLFPLFVEIADSAQAVKVAEITRAVLLKEGGIITTNNLTGQQWDAPNGWAPLQWVAVKGFSNYNHTTLAKDIALRWITLNEKVYKSTGKMMEKYNVLNTGLEAGGGEYPGQDGFGWTNGVYLKLRSLYTVK